MPSDFAGRGDDEDDGTTAMAGLLGAIILLATLIVFRGSRRWVYYEN